MSDAPIPSSLVRSRVSVLLVDDTATGIEVLSQIFEDHDYRVEVVGTGDAALERLARGGINVSLINVRLPDVEAPALLRDARRLQPDLKCIVITWDGSLDAVPACVREGAYWILRGPMIADPYVEAVVARALEEQRLELLARSLVEEERLDHRLGCVATHLNAVAGVSHCVILLAAGANLLPRMLVAPGWHGEPPRARMRLPIDELAPGFRRILDGGRAVAVGDACAEGWLPAALTDRWAIRSCLLLPLTIGSTLIGAAILFEPDTRREFTADQLRQVQTAGYMATPSIRQAQAVEEERDTLRVLVESLLGRPPSWLKGRVATRYEPAYPSHQIGGDYYDFIDLGDEQVGIVLGDVCGKGREAVVYVAMAKYILRAYAREESGPASVLTRLNEALLNELPDGSIFLTMVYAVLDWRNAILRYANAAHPAPFVCLPGDANCIELRPTGGLLGAFPGMQFQERQLELRPGSTLSLFTDGVTEARRRGELLDGDIVRSVLASCVAESPDVVAETLYGSALEAAEGVLRDDVAIVVVRYE